MNFWIPVDRLLNPEIHGESEASMYKGETNLSIDEYLSHNTLKDYVEYL